MKRRVDFCFLPWVLAFLALCSCSSGGEGVVGKEFPLKEANPGNSLMARWAGKEVLESRVIDDMEGKGNWVVREGSPSVGYTRENYKYGTQALRQRVSMVDSAHILSPANRSEWGSFNADQGGWTCVALEFDEPQDWSEWNRISLWVYIHPSRNPNVSFALDLVDAATHDSVLDPGRETNVDIPQGEWTQMLWEIDYYPRESILRLEICQTMTGFDREIGEQYVTIDFDRLELQKVEPDHYEGWDIPEGEFAFSHVGYRPGDSKVALACYDAGVKAFQLLDGRGNAVFTGTPARSTNRGNDFAVLDFSDFRSSGSYSLKYGEAVSRPFPIDEDVWLEPMYAALNFYFCQRCGYPVPGIHGVCHEDVQGFHGDVRKSVNGGWHDAGDLSQGTWRTAYACFALLNAVEAAPGFATKLQEEASWGVDWLLKTRFGDGFHQSWSTVRIFSDGITGTCDDIVTPASYVPWELFLTSAVFLRSGHPDEACEDWEFAMRKADGGNYLEASWGALASALLYQRSGERKYRDAALNFGRRLMLCQEQGKVHGIPYHGYFYTDTTRRAILHDCHAAFNEAPMLALGTLCRVFPEEAAPFLEAARLYAGYLKDGSAISAPYNLPPAGIFRRRDMLSASDLAQYEAGTQINGEYAIRTFPVWKDHIFHGSTHFHLSEAWALAEAAVLLDDSEAMSLVQRQLEWTLGRNPFGMSLMYGVGYNYAPLFAYCTHNIVGALPVGMDCFHDDEPFWNGSACATSKEIWVEPVSRFLGALSHFILYESPVRD